MAAILAATASRSAGTPVIGGYWFSPLVMASVTACDQLGVAVEIREALAQVDRALFGGELGHHGEDGGADGGQLGLQLRGAFERRCLASS